MAKWTDVAIIHGKQLIALARPDSDIRYRIQQDEVGNVRCTCPAWMFAKHPDGRPEARTCKHTRAYAAFVRKAL